MRYSISRNVAPKSAWIALVFAFGLSSMALGAVPKILHYQGYLTDATGAAVDCPDGLACNGLQYDMTFRLYDSAQGGAMLWEEQVTAVPIRQGVFDVLLGAANPIDAGTLDFDGVYLGLTINDTAELTPRQQFASAAYAIRAEYAQDATSLGGKAAADYVATDDVAGLCITDEELATLLAEKNYCTECYTDADVDIYLTDQGYMPGPGYTDGQVQTYLDAQTYVSGPHTTDTDTQLSATQVLQMVANGGYTNGPHTTDTQLTAAQVLQIVAVNGGYATGPHTTDTHLTSAEVLSMVSTGGYATGGHTVDTTRSDAEIQAVVGPHTTDTDTHLSSAEVLSMVNGGGYVTGGHTVDTTRSDAEIQAVVGPHTTDTQLSTDEVLKIVADAGFLTASDIPPSIPSGMIGFFPGSCPVGWTDLSTNFGGRALVLAPNGGTAGANATSGTALKNLATKTISTVPTHTHGLGDHDHKFSANGGTSSGGGHSHSYSKHQGGEPTDGCRQYECGGGKADGTKTTSSGGSHSHGFSIGGTTESTSGSTSATGADSVDVTMPYIQLRACQAP